MADYARDLLMVLEWSRTALRA